MNFFKVDDDKYMLEFKQRPVSDSKLHAREVLAFQ